MADMCDLFAHDPVFGYPGDPGPVPYPCDEEAACTITFACIHEHIDRPRACSGCVVDVQRCAPDLLCTPCQGCEQPHDCPVEVLLEWDSGDKTIVQEISNA